MRRIAIALGSALCLVALSGCIPDDSAPVMDQAGASCFVDGDAAVLMLPVQVGHEMELTELALLDPAGLELEAYTVVKADDEPFATDRPPSASDIDGMQGPGPADPPIAIAPGARSWLVAVVSTDDDGGTAGGFSLTWDDDEAGVDARLEIEIGSVCSM